MKDDELEAVFHRWADQSKWEDMRREWEEEQEREREEAAPGEAFRSLCGIVALVMILVWLVGCATPVQIAKTKPQIPRDIELHCINGNWAIVSESAGEAAAFPLAAACGKGAI